MTEPKKETVLMVHNYYQIPGGEDTVVANEKKMLEDHGHKVVLYTRHNNELKNMTIFDKFLLIFRTIFNWKTYKEVQNIICEEDIDIVHVHNTLPIISPAVYYAAVFLNKPVVQTVHNFRMLCPGATFFRDGHICEDCLDKGLVEAIKHGCYRGSRVQTTLCVVNMTIHHWAGIYKKIGYICLTEFNKDKFRQNRDIRERQIFVKPNFVKASQEIVPYHERMKYFIYAGRLDMFKGIDILLQAWEIMGEEAPELLIYGDGPLKGKCKRKIYSKKINAQLMGFVSNLEIRSQLKRSMALILPTQLYEGFPMSIVEAFSVGTPVLCSDLGNSGSLVKDGVNGYKFQCNSPEDIAKKVMVMMGEDMCENTYNIYRHLYCEEKNYEEYIDIFRKWSNDSGKIDCEL